jgi:hypothetical protein
MLSIGRRLAARRQGDESGSIVIVMVVIFVVTIGLVAVLLQVNGSLELTKNDQRRTNAFQFANAGVDQALYRIDTRSLPSIASGSYQPTFLAGRFIGFTESLSVGTSQFQVVATQAPAGQDTTWQVRSVGTDPSGRQRVAIATLQAKPLFVNGFFTLEDFTLTGNQDTPVAYDSRVCPTAATSCQLATPIAGTLGTNAEFHGATATTASFVSRWGGFNMYGRATQAAADQACDEGDCGTAPKVQAITNQLEITVPDTPGTALPCPNGGNLGTTTIAPGDYVCDNVNITGTVTVSGSSGNVRIWAKKTFSAGAGAIVNRNQPTPRFQIFYPEQATATSSTICDAELWALLYTPGLKIDCTGDHQPTMYGAVIARFHGGTGNHFDFHWDIASISDVNNGKFVVKNWRECPFGVADC